MSNSPFE